MNQNLFAAGLLIFGFSLLVFMPASMQKTWKDLDFKPPAGDAIVMMMRFLGLMVILFGLAVFTGAVDMSAMINNNP